MKLSPTSGRMSLTLLHTLRILLVILVAGAMLFFWRGYRLGPKIFSERLLVACPDALIVLPLGLAIALTGLTAGGWLSHRHSRSQLRRHRETSEHYQRLAFYDPLTGLPNRSLLHDRLEQNLAEARRFGSQLAVIFVDLDRFKIINDSLGHAAGDRLLQMAAERMQKILRENDTVARYAGDEFVIILSGFRTLENLPHIARKLLQTLSSPYPLPGHEVVASASLGIAIYPEDGIDGERLLRNADAAMYAAKNAKGNVFRFFSREMERQVTRRLQQEARLRQAVEDRQFRLLYQPQFDMRTLQMVGVEALLRWDHPTLGMLTPEHFIDLAEETGLILPMGEWILREACRQWQRWKTLGGRSLDLAINLTNRQFTHKDLVPNLRNILAEYGVQGNFLELELTESVLMQNAESADRIVRGFKDLGVKLSIDDFGSGYFSLACLQRLSLDRLKIAPSFVHGGPENIHQASIVTTIIDLARNLDLELIAEGVESAEQITFLLQQGCHIGQGHYFAEPCDSDGILARLDRRPATAGFGYAPQGLSDMRS